MAIDPVTIGLLASTGFSVFGQLTGGQAAQEVGELEGFNIETDRELGKAEALRNSNQRKAIADQNLSANIAAFSAAGRDIGGMDRSVQATLDRQKEIVGSDLSDIALMSKLNAAKATGAAAGARAEGRAKKKAATIGALTSIASGYFQYSAVKASAPQSAQAPTTSLRPRLRPY